MTNPPPRSIDPRIGRDLEAVCLKCLEKDPARRYPSAGALAEDIDRWLTGRPVRARPIGPAARTWRWARDNPLVAGLAGSVALLALAGLVGLVVGLASLAREQGATRAALAVATKERTIAEHRAAEAERQRRHAEEGDISVLQGITEPLKMLADPDLGRDPAFVRLRGEVIGKAIAVLDAYSAKVVDESGAIDYQIHVGLLRTAADDHPGAWGAYRRAVDQAGRLAERRPDDLAVRDRLGMARLHLGMDLWRQGRVDEATPELRLASADFRRVADSAGPGDPFYLHHVAWFLIFCPDVRLRDHARALELAEIVRLALPDHEETHPTLLIGLRPRLTLGLALYRNGRFAEARTPIEESIAIRGGGDAYEGFTLAMILARMGDRPAGLGRFEDAHRRMRRRRYGDFELHFLRDEATEAPGLPRFDDSPRP